MWVRVRRALSTRYFLEEAPELPQRMAGLGGSAVPVGWWYHPAYGESEVKGWS